MIGALLDNRYELIEKVGTGGMADVYKAKCNLLNRNVAIKVLKDEYNDYKNKKENEEIETLDLDITNNDSKKPIVNIDADSVVVNENVITDDEFFDDFFTD